MRPSVCAAQLRYWSSSERNHSVVPLHDQLNHFRIADKINAREQPTTNAPLCDVYTRCVDYHTQLLNAFGARVSPVSLKDPILHQEKTSLIPLLLEPIDDLV